MEKHFFFKNKVEKNLLGFLCTPEKNLLNTGIVICQPIAEERSRSKRVLVNLSRYLAYNGYQVLLFDYFGEGDSEGSFEEADINSRLSDIEDAIKFLRNGQNIKIGLIGLRCGASLAAISAKKTIVDFMVLLQPIFDGQEFINDWLKINLSAQLVTYKKIIANRKELINKLLRGENIENGGFIISERLYNGFKMIESSSILSHEFAPIAIIEINETPKIIKSLACKNVLENNKNYAFVKEKAFWNSLKNYNPMPESLFSSILEIISNFNVNNGKNC